MPSLVRRRDCGRADGVSARCSTLSIPLFALAAMLLLAALLVMAFWLGMRGRAAFCDPFPDDQPVFLSVGSLLGSVLDGAVGDMAWASNREGDEEGFPHVNWDYWCSVNPDVVGWITVPGTVVNGPVVLAPPDDPDYYLSHDVYGDYSWYGCFYLDASCSVGGLLGSPNAVVFGHNMSRVDGSMFTAFSEYVDLDFATSHAEILLQTPDAKEKLAVVGARVISGDSADKRTSFADSEDFKAYRDDCFSSCEVMLPVTGDAEREEGAKGSGEVGRSIETERFFTFVTCSYTRYQNERTLVYAVPQEWW